MKYKVTGTIELNWENVVEADSEEEAEEWGRGFAEDGHGLGMPVDRPEVSGVDLVTEEEKEAG